MPLANCIAMARGREREPAGLGSYSINAEYCPQRAKARLIITKATQTSAVVNGYFDKLGLHTSEQLAGACVGTVW
ncbi:hypothetical protein [Sphingobium sp. DC-2]|uniref:hypothetical protein n=1 Tax=Sphingobium sp. DC-2 TaxID=1303256 RepID=UPI0004C3D2C8